MTPTTCTVGLSQAFILSMDLAKAPAGGYIGVQTQVDYSQLVTNGGMYMWNVDAANEVVWPDDTFRLRLPTSPTGSEGLVSHAAATGFLPPIPTSTYTGSLVQIVLKCGSGVSSNTISLVPYSAGNTNGTSIKLPPPAGTNVPASDSLTLNCAGGPPPPPTGMQLRVIGGSCDSQQTPTACTVPLNQGFILSVDLADDPVGGYIGIQTQVDYSDLVANGGSYWPAADPGDEVVWTDGCCFQLRTPALPAGSEGLVSHTGASGFTPPFPVSHATGSLVQIVLTCGSSDSINTINLVPYSGGNTSGAGIKTSPLSTVPESDSLSLNCSGAAPPPLSVEGTLSTGAGTANILAGESVRWTCTPNMPLGQTTLRLHYAWGDDDVNGAGIVSLTHNPPVDLQSVECLINGSSLDEIMINWVLIDPSGTVKDAISSAPIAGATVTLQKHVGVNWVDVTNPAEMDPDINPQSTSLSGHYGWDVVPGEYRVQVSKSGCTSNTGGPVTIPPPVTNLDVGISCSDPDADGLPTFVETAAAGGTHTNPNLTDTDGDTVPDGAEDCDADSLTNLAEVTITGTDPCGTDNVDSDLDGCSNIEEFSANPEVGGARDSSNFWDFFDVWTHPSGNPTGWDRDGTVGLFGDIFGVVGRFGAAGDPFANPLTPPTDETGYHPDYDRSPPAGDPWHVGRGDGTIDLFNDIFGVAYQFGHTCNGPS